MRRVLFCRTIGLAKHTAGSRRSDFFTMIDEILPRLDESCVEGRLSVGCTEAWTDHASFISTRLRPCCLTVVLLVLLIPSPVPRL